MGQKNYRCEICWFSFVERFGIEFIECHHIVPRGETGARRTRLDDLILVCPNCDRMLQQEN
ncbi:MAG: HNH endonuclease [Acidobacteria bacterium]|nr:HNH endonuclease [Acidobacteriota bacterium]